VLGPVLRRQRIAGTVAARCSTRHRHWRRVGSRAAAQNAGKSRGQSQLPLFFPSSLPVRSNVTCKEEKNASKVSVLPPFQICFYFCFLSVFLSFFFWFPLLCVAADDWEAAGGCASVVSGRRNWRRKECWLIASFGWKWRWICGRRRVGAAAGGQICGVQRATGNRWPVEDGAAVADEVDDADGMRRRCC